MEEILNPIQNRVSLWHFLRGNKMSAPMDFDKLRGPAVLLGISGSYLVAVPDLEVAGWLSWAIANPLMVAAAVRDRDPYTGILFLVYFSSVIFALVNRGVI